MDHFKSIVFGSFLVLSRLLRLIFTSAVNFKIPPPNDLYLNRIRLLIDVYSP